jgi:hypothetical protein
VCSLEKVVKNLRMREAMEAQSYKGSFIGLGFFSCPQRTRFKRPKIIKN